MTSQLEPEHSQCLTWALSLRSLHSLPRFPIRAAAGDDDDDEEEKEACICYK